MTCCMGWDFVRRKRSGGYATNICSGGSATISVFGDSVTISVDRSMAKCRSRYRRLCAVVVGFVPIIDPLLMALCQPKYGFVPS